jgi:XTP/dITP diphosphohydrolase
VKYTYEGSVEGFIAKEMRGNQGFGYDPLFVPEGFDQTLSELGPGVKNKISHRAMAFRELLAFLEEVWK